MRRAIQRAGAAIGRGVRGAVNFIRNLFGGGRNGGNAGGAGSSGG